MNEENVYRKRAAMLIGAAFGGAPAVSDRNYPVYSEAVDIEAEYLRKKDSSSGLKKLTLGDSTEEYFEGGSSSSRSDGLICGSALMLLEKIYDIRHVSLRR